jgi:hypothetical protein
MYCIVVPVKFDDVLSISFLRKKQTFSKKGGQKYTFSKKFHFQKTFQTSPSGKWTGDPWKKLLFFASHFSPEWDRQPAFGLMQKEMTLLSIE